MIETNETVQTPLNEQFALQRGQAAPFVQRPGMERGRGLDAHRPGGLWLMGLPLPRK